LDEGRDSAVKWLRRVFRKRPFAMALVELNWDDSVLVKA